MGASLLFTEILYLPVVTPNNLEISQSNLAHLSLN